MDVLTLAGLDLAISHDFAMALLDVSSSLSSGARRRFKRAHWLCEMLADAADAIDPSTIASAAGDVFTDALVDAGVPRWAAGIAGRGVARAAGNSLASLLPGARLCLGLRVLALLVCPDTAGCPVGDRLSVPVVAAALEAR